MSAASDVVVAGAGPAGLALATACAERGLAVTVVSPNADAHWRNTYGAWADELVSLGVAGHVAGRWPVTAVVGPDRRFLLARPYVLLDNERLAAALRARLEAAGGRMLRGTATSADEHGVVLRDGSTLAARLVVDATGHRPSLAHGLGNPVAYQSAWGVEATCDVPPGEPAAMTLMDVRPAPPDDDPDPTFLYAMDLGGGRWFVEETSLARAEPMPMERLEARLRRRMEAMGVRLSDEGAVERCVFPMGGSVPPPQTVLSYGAAAAMVHPATGYQVGTALRRAPEVALAIADAIARDDGHPGEQAWDVLWSADLRRQRALLDVGLASLLRLDADGFAQFFSAFFTLPEGRWRGYLSGASSAAELRGTLRRTFMRAKGLRGTLVAAALRDAPRQALTGLGLGRPALSAADSSPGSDPH